jgi:hypothetical protein
VWKGEKASPTHYSHTHADQQLRVLGRSTDCRSIRPPDSPDHSSHHLHTRPAGRCCSSPCAKLVAVMLREQADGKRHTDRHSRRRRHSGDGPLHSAGSGRSRPDHLGSSLDRSGRSRHRNVGRLGRDRLADGPT